MAKEVKIYRGQVEGEDPKLYRSTDPRLVRKHILADIHPPKVDVRIPTTEEAMEMALDGVAIITIADDEGSGAGGPDAGAASGDLLDTGNSIEGDAVSGSADDDPNTNVGLDHPREEPSEEVDINGDVVEDMLPVAASDGAGDDEPF